MIPPRPRLAVVMLTLLAVAPSVGWAATRSDMDTAGRGALLVSPERPTGPSPLVVALHGCDQSAEAFLSTSGLEALVDDAGFILVLPRARAASDNPLGCWPWWQPENQRRNGTDPSYIVSVIRALDADLDPARIYVLGLSSGGAMAAVLGTVYPDVFAAVGIHSGLGFAIADGAACAVKALGDGPDGAESRGRLAYLHQPARRVVPTMIVHGLGDDVVDPRHAYGLVREIAQRNDFVDDGRDNDSFDDQPDSETAAAGPCRAGEDGDCYRYELKRYEDRSGDVMIARVLVEDLGHAWSGGAPGAEYTDPRGPDAGRLFWQFFENHVLDRNALPPAARPHCLEWWASPWWHYWWLGTMTFGELACDMSPWRVVWRHRIDGVSGPGRCP